MLCTLKQPLQGHNRIIANKGKNLESLKSNNNIKTPLTPEREGTKQKEQL